jgi:hypothetical protein
METGSLEFCGFFGYTIFGYYQEVYSIAAHDVSADSGLY